MNPMNRLWMLVAAAALVFAACSEAEVESTPPAPVAAEVAETTIPVEGMTCSSCENFIQQTLERREGVRQAAASHVERMVVVSYDPALITPEELVAEINKTSYTAHMPGTELLSTAPATAPGEGMH